MAYHGSEGDVLIGLPEESCLQDTDVPLQGDGALVLELMQEPCFYIFALGSGNLWPFGFGDKAA